MHIHGDTWDLMRNTIVFNFFSFVVVVGNLDEIIWTHTVRMYTSVRLIFLKIALPVVITLCTAYQLGC